MILDRYFTKLAPKGWEIWKVCKTHPSWQAIATWAREDNPKSYGQFRHNPELALKDAERLTNSMYPRNGGQVPEVM